MFSDRVPRDLTANRLARAVASMRAERRPYIDLTLSNPTHADAAIEYPDDLLAPLADPRGLVYSPSPAGDPAARHAIARDYARRGIDVPAERIVLTASTSDAYSLIFKLLANAGDEVLVPRPSYPLFEHLGRLDLVSTRPYDLDIHAGWSIDFASVEAALTPRARAALIVSPNNPTGSFVTADELDRLAAVCAPRGVAVVADEVFADYELEPGAAAAAGHVAARRDILSFSLGGLSKSVGLPQVKLGWIAVGGPEAIVRAALERLEHIADTYLAVSTPVQVAAPALLERGGAIRARIAQRIAANHRALVAQAAEVSSWSVLRSGGGWYGVVQVPSIEYEEDLVVRLLMENHVLAHPGYFFDFPRESFLIVSLLPAVESFANGLQRVVQHFDVSAGHR
jgi:aspartate/methionine/tyrosine aminotransferase